MSRYNRLLNWLERAESRVRLSLGDVEKILDQKLSPSALVYPAFWARGNHTGRILAKAGWRARPRLEEGYIDFERSSVAPESTIRREPGHKQRVSEALHPPSIGQSSRQDEGMPHGRAALLGRFYELLDQVKTNLGGYRCLKDCHGRLEWPERGVYFFFESEEVRTDSGTGPRVVRIGTHALSATSQTSLWNRLSQHRGTLKPFGGNHRGSKFRSLVGKSLASKYRELDVATWGQGNTASASVRAAESALEEQVSIVIGSMPFLWLEIDDPPGSQSLRGYIEKNSIALLSNYHRVPLDPASASWLGHHSDRAKVRWSGLWNSDHVHKSCDPAFLDIFEELVFNSVTSNARSQADLRKHASFPSSNGMPARGHVNKLRNSVLPIDAARTLFLLPCSAKKASQAAERAKLTSSVLDDLPPRLANRLRHSREVNARSSSIDEGTMLPAWQRYAGYLFVAAREALAHAVSENHHILIVSGGYGVVKATEPIGLYEAVFKASQWQPGLLESVIQEYCLKNRLTAARVFMAGSTGYVRLARSIAWEATGVTDALLLSPTATAGAMVKVPRALGEAFAVLASGAAISDWRSSDGLALEVARLH